MAKPAVLPGNYRGTMVVRADPQRAAEARRPAATRTLVRPASPLEMLGFATEQTVSADAGRRRWRLGGCGSTRRVAVVLRGAGRLRRFWRAAAGDHFRSVHRQAGTSAIGLLGVHAVADIGAGSRGSSGCRGRGTTRVKATLKSGCNSGDGPSWGRRTSLLEPAAAFAESYLRDAVRRAPRRVDQHVDQESHRTAGRADVRHANKTVLRDVLLICAP